MSSISNYSYNRINSGFVLQSPESLFAKTTTKFNTISSYTDNVIISNNNHTGTYLVHPSEIENDEGEGFMGTVSSLWSKAKNYISGFFTSSDVELPYIRSTQSLITTQYKDANNNNIRLNSEAAYCFDKLMNITKSMGIEVRVSSSYRSVSTQETLYNNAVKKYGSESAARKWVASPGKSQHNFGNAIDMSMYKNGKKVSQKDFDNIIAQVGFYRPMSYEGWHIEPISTKGIRSSITKQPHFHV